LSRDRRRGKPGKMEDGLGDGGTRTRPVKGKDRGEKKGRITKPSSKSLARKKGVKNSGVLGGAAGEKQRNLWRACKGRVREGKGGGDLGNDKGQSKQKGGGPRNRKNTAISPCEK